jgi:hypothetical protein
MPQMVYRNCPKRNASNAPNVDWLVYRGRNRLKGPSWRPAEGREILCLHPSLKPLIRQPSSYHVAH